MDILGASSWWTYYHMKPECISKTDVVKADLETKIVDVKRLPNHLKESVEASQISYGWRWVMAGVYKRARAVFFFHKLSLTLHVIYIFTKEDYNKIIGCILNLHVQFIFEIHVPLTWSGYAVVLKSMCLPYCLCCSS